MTARGPETARAVDRSVLEELLEDLLGNVLTFERFVADYVALWSGRMTTLDAALARTDLAAADTGVLSIRSSSIMLGCAYVATISDSMLAAVRRADCLSAQAWLPELDAAGTEACHELSLLLVEETHRSWGEPEQHP
ncbi:hypothetical protein ASG53_14855 [Sanguibacter sp. Leaf3]|nr:hypothetical protein ASG53_14855 [Sanguibacter sp. Leaf3]